MKHLCVKCHDSVVPQARRQLGYLTCMSCGETAASKVRHTIVPMAKSNYVVVSDPTLLKGLNKYVQT
jgi:ribosomal protein L37AE/L43A